MLYSIKDLYTLLASCLVCVYKYVPYSYIFVTEHMNMLEFLVLCSFYVSEIHSVYGLYMYLVSDAKFNSAASAEMGSAVVS